MREVSVIMIAEVTHPQKIALIRRRINDRDRKT